MTTHVIANSVKSFNKYVNDVRFVDFMVVSPTVAIITRDGSEITNKSVSAKILSKTLTFQRRSSSYADPERDILLGLWACLPEREFS